MQKFVNHERDYNKKDVKKAICCNGIINPNLYESLVGNRQTIINLSTKTQFERIGKDILPYILGEEDIKTNHKRYKEYISQISKILKNSSNILDFEDERLCDLYKDFQKHLGKDAKVYLLKDRIADVKKHFEIPTNKDNIDSLQMNNVVKDPNIYRIGWNIVEKTCDDSERMIMRLKETSDKLTYKLEFMYISKSSSGDIKVLKMQDNELVKNSLDIEKEKQGKDRIYLIDVNNIKYFIKE